MNQVSTLPPTNADTWIEHNGMDYKLSKPFNFDPDTIVYFGETEYYIKTNRFVKRIGYFALRNANKIYSYGRNVNAAVTKKKQSKATLFNIISGIYFPLSI